MILDFFSVNLRRQTSTLILPLDIKYSTRDLISDVSHCSWTLFVQYRLHNANDV